MLDTKTYIHIPNKIPISTPNIVKLWNLVKRMLSTPPLMMDELQYQQADEYGQLQDYD